jgi:diaminopimelate epimerase
VKFFKMHGTGNDFVLLDGRDLVATDFPKLACAMCDRHFGIGSDGLLLVETSPIANFRMRMYNPDGTEAEMCGNGIRCFAKYLYDSGAWRQPSVDVETGAGVKRLELDISDGLARQVRVAMGIPSFDPDVIPLAVEAPAVDDLPLCVDGHELRLTVVSMGNPHAIQFVDDVAGFPLERIGPLVERDPLFPRRVNFEIARPISNRRIEVRVWERGAGITLACGTGACAVYAAARRKGLVADSVTVALPGGELEMAVGLAGQIYLTGPATLVYTGEWLRE